MFALAHFFILVSDMDQSIFNIKRGMTLTDPFVKLYPPQSTILPLKSCVFSVIIQSVSVKMILFSSDEI